VSSKRNASPSRNGGLYLTAETQDELKEAIEKTLGKR